MFVREEIIALLKEAKSFPLIRPELYFQLYFLLRPTYGEVVALRKATISSSTFNVLFFSYLYYINSFWESQL